MEYSFSSQLVDALDIDELSTSRLTYNGIVDFVNERGERYASVAYRSTVKVGIRANEIRIETDDAAKTVRIALPTIVIQDPVIDASSLSFIPENPLVDTQQAIAACREDARQEALQSELLMQTAEENLKSIIEALTLPLIQDQGYAIKW